MTIKESRAVITCKKEYRKTKNEPGVQYLKTIRKIQRFFLLWSLIELKRRIGRLFSIPVDSSCRLVARLGPWFDLHTAPIFVARKMYRRRRRRRCGLWSTVNYSWPTWCEWRVRSRKNIHPPPPPVLVSAFFSFLVAHVLAAKRDTRTPTTDGDWSSLFWNSFPFSLSLSLFLCACLSRKDLGLMALLFVPVCVCCCWLIQSPLPSATGNLFRDLEKEASETRENQTKTTRSFHSLIEESTA